MKRLLIGLAFMASVAGVGGVATAFANQPVDPAISVANTDPTMKAAIAKARATLPEFWRKYESPAPGEQNFSLKVRIVDRMGAEHFWLTNVVRTGERYAGTISNDPQTVRSVTLGQRYEFPEADISDWTFMRNGKIVGNETMRPLLARMPAEEAAPYRAMLETP